MRSGEEIERPRFPMIVLKTPKGWTGIKEFRGNKIEGNCLSHQVVCTEAKTDAEQRAAVEEWMRSYKFNELFDAQNGFADAVLACVPDEVLRMSENDHAFSGRMHKDLHLPHAKEFDGDGECTPGEKDMSSMRKAGAYLKTVLERNAENKNFRVMSPDETYSNKLDDVFQASPRQFAWPIMPWDKDLAHSGRIMEMLSEHSLQGLAQGYILTGRHAVFSSYEAFVPIIGSMADQYAKFLKIARETLWRGDVSSFNYILTSSGWRQEHNGFSHQNPGFIDNMLEKHGCFINVYFPPDAHSTITVLERCLKSKNEINIIVAGKTPEPCWLSMEQAWEELVRGLMIWDFASDPDPDIVFAGIGDYMTKEALAAIDIVKTEAPEVKARFVNIVELSALGIGSAAACRLG
ncbi:MAG TPA: phosphoketolase family protein, partial [Acidobacteriota bacterium]|nr:phosphoketolase family protein [Acidobacteriota bacterium]